jgi:hypothetical protein
VGHCAFYFSLINVPVAELLLEIRHAATAVEDACIINHLPSNSSVNH